jgi:hypothetical protein
MEPAPRAAPRAAAPYDDDVEAAAAAEAAAEDSTATAAAAAEDFEELIGPMDPFLFRFVRGTHGARQRRIEGESGARLRIPGRTAAAPPGGACVSARAATREAAAAAAAAVAAAVACAVGSRAVEYSHFFSLPLATPEVAARAEAFRAAALADPDAVAGGLAAQAFTPARHLHLTLGMLKLYTADARRRAAAALESLAPAAAALAAAGPLRVRLRGLRVLRGTPDGAAAHVLYSTVEDAEPGSGAAARVQALADAAQAAAVEAGLAPAGAPPVRLHATLINTRYGAAAPGGRCAIDARALVQRFGEELDLGMVTIGELHLSRRGAWDRATGFYRAAARLRVSPAP